VKCEIINIVDHYQTDKTSDSAAFIAGVLSSMGMKAKRINTVLPDKKELSGLFRETVKRSEIIISIGGLGAGPGDITKEVLAETLKIKLNFSRKAMENIARYFAAQGKEVPGSFDKQAEIFDGAVILENAKGSCPGQIVKVEDNKIIILLPEGIEEIGYILNSKLLDFLKDKFERQITKTADIHVIGICREEAVDRLKEVLSVSEEAEEGAIEFYFKSSPGVVDIRIVSMGSNELLVDENLHKTKTEVYAVLEDNIFGEDGESIEAVIAKMLTRSRKTLSVAESCTGGLLSSVITDAPGSSIIFKQGIVVYSIASKKKMLDVKSETIEKHSAVSEEVAREMAENMKKIYKTDFALAVTGYAGPSADLLGMVGSGYIGLASPEKTNVRKVEFTGSRKEVKLKFTYAALEMLWSKLKQDREKNTRK
jgi:nicotinamide-nucleotide amidase